jgi:uncharacterized paraquat-inducible protein A
MPAPPRYSRGQRYCGHCCGWIRDAGARCPRCGYTLRWGPRKYSRRKRAQTVVEKPAIATE